MRSIKGTITEHPGTPDLHKDKIESRNRWFSIGEAFGLTDAELVADELENDPNPDIKEVLV